LDGRHIKKKQTEAGKDLGVVINIYMYIDVMVVVVVMKQAEHLYSGDGASATRLFSLDNPGLREEEEEEEEEEGWQAKRSGWVGIAGGVGLGLLRVRVTHHCADKD